MARYTGRLRNQPAPVPPDQGLFSLPQEKVIKILSSWASDIQRFVMDGWGFKPYTADIETMKVGELKIDTQQAMFFQEVNKLRYTKVALRDRKKLDSPLKLEYQKKTGIVTRAGKGTGKDWELAMLGLWFLFAHHPAKVVCVAPSGAQLQKILWAEVRKWLEWPTCRIKDWYEVTKDTIYFRDPTTGERVSTRQMFARTTSVSADSEVNTLSGIHETNLLVIFDECSGISDAVFEPLTNTLTDPNNWVVMMFNPERNSGYAVDCDKGKFKNQFIQLHMDFELTDRMTAEQKQQQLNNLETKYGGKETNGYRVFVKGEYPSAEADSFIPWSNTYDAMMRIDYVVPDDYPVKAGIDVGLLEDKTVVSIFKGPNQIGLERIGSDIHHNDEFKLAEYIVDQVFVPYEVKICTVELDGLGHSFMTILRKYCMYKGIRVLGINTSNQAYKPDIFFSRREEMWDHLRRIIMADEIKLLHNEDQLVEITRMKKEEGDQWKGKLKLIKNKKIKKEIKRSPDMASALIMAISTNEKPLVKTSPIMDKYGFNSLQDELPGVRNFKTA